MRYRPEYDMKLIGRNLKRLREMKNLSVEEVRRYLRLGSVQAVYKYEEGKSYPQTDNMLALMELYEADLDDIIREHEESRQMSSDVNIFEDSDVLLFNVIGEHQNKRLKNSFEFYTKCMHMAIG